MQCHEIDRLQKEVHRSQVWMWTGKQSAKVVMGVGCSKGLQIEEMSMGSTWTSNHTCTKVGKHVGDISVLKAHPPPPHKHIQSIHSQAVAVLATLPTAIHTGKRKDSWEAGQNNNCYYVSTSTSTHGSCRECMQQCAAVGTVLDPAGNYNM